MKVRMGFVSNSSSSSFCFIGINLSGEELTKDLLDKIIKMYENEEIDVARIDEFDEVHFEDIHEDEIAELVGSSNLVIGASRDGGDEYSVETIDINDFMESALSALSVLDDLDVDPDRMRLWCGMTYNG